MRESEAISNYSNILLLRPPQRTHNDIVKIDIRIAKNRDGKTDMAQAVWVKPLFTIRDQCPEDLGYFAPALSK